MPQLHCFKADPTATLAYDSDRHRRTLLPVVALQFLEQGQDRLRGYIAAYQDYADHVLQQVAKSTPEWLSTYVGLRDYVIGELESVADRLDVLSAADLALLSDVLQATEAVMAAAEYHDDQVAMLGHALEYLQSALVRLHLLDSGTTIASHGQLAAGSMPTTVPSSPIVWPVPPTVATELGASRSGGRPAASTRRPGPDSAAYPSAARQRSVVA